MGAKIGEVVEEDWGTHSKAAHTARALKHP